MNKKKFEKVQIGDRLELKKSALEYWDKHALEDCTKPRSSEVEQEPFAMRKMIALGLPYVAIVRNKNSYGGGENPAAHLEIYLSALISFTTWISCVDLRELK